MNIKNIKHINWRKEITDWRNWVWIGMATLGTILQFIAFLLERPEVQNFIRHLVII